MAKVPRTYLHGVPSWIDVVQPDLKAAQEFYGGLLGWTFQEWSNVELGHTYLLALLDGEVAAGLSSREGEVAWRTYVTVDDLDAATDAALNSGASLVIPKSASADDGRWCAVRDPAGAEFGLWEARGTNGAQVVNVPGAWTFTALHMPSPQTAIDWYAVLFGWVEQPVDGTTLLKVPGFGQHLADTSDPDIFERLAYAGEGFADVVAWAGGAAGPATWRTVFLVEDRDKATARAEQLGATVLSYYDYAWARNVIIRDPQGAVLSLTQFCPPDGKDVRL
jgi:uncharacterized protein